MLSRKRFISISLLGAVATLIPSYLFSEELSKTILGSTDDINTLLKQAADFRKLGKLSKAKQIYLQVIDLNPQEVRAYDGIRKIMMAKGKQEIEIVKIFKKAVNQNPDSIELKQRLYNQYFKAALGNKKTKNFIGGNKRLLQDVKDNYDNFKLNHSNKKNVEKQLEKINRLLSYNADNTNPHLNSNLKQYKKAQYKNFKKRFDGLTTPQIHDKLSELINKPFSKDRQQHIRELYGHSVRGLRKEKNHVQALDKAMAYYQLDNNDPLFLKYIRDLSKYQKNHDNLISVERQNHDLKNNYWSACALFDALIKKSENTNQSPSQELDTLLNKMFTALEDPKQKFEYATRKIKLSFLKKDWNTAKSNLLDLTDSKAGTSSPHSIDRINVLCARYFAKIGDNESKNKILMIAQNPKNYENETDDFFKNIVLMNSNRSLAKSIHLQNLQRIINQID